MLCNSTKEIPKQRRNYHSKKKEELVYFSELTLESKTLKNNIFSGFNMYVCPFIGFFFYKLNKVIININNKFYISRYKLIYIKSFTYKIYHTT